MKRILIVEDDMAMASLLALHLRGENYDVEIAVDAVQATQHMHEKRPDILLLDISIPAGSGFTIVESVKTVPEFFGIPFIFLTKNDDPMLRRQAMSLGARGFLTKPYTIQDVIKKIEYVLLFPNA